MLDLLPPRWAARIVLAVYIWGFISAVVILGMLVGWRVRRWLERRGGW